MAQRTVNNPPFGWRQNGLIVEDITELYSMVSSPSIETVTQLTDITTSVTINGTLGKITTVSHSYSPNSIVEFTVNNSSVTADSMILTTFEVNQSFGGVINIDDVTVGSFKVKIRNNSALSTLGSAGIIHFKVFN